MVRAPCWLLDLRGGLVPFPDAWALQRALVQARQVAAIPDVLMLLEHAPVITLGRSAKRDHLLVAPDALGARGIDTFEIERGGDVTYHGPGQLVGYPILDLRALDEDIVRYMRSLEESVIRTLTAFGIAAKRERGYPGVWVDDAKICAVGVAVRRRVTMHGFALNVTIDPAAFTIINPCGLSRPVTSMARILSRAVDMNDVRQVYAERFTDVFGIPLMPVARDAVEALLQRVNLGDSPPLAQEAAGVR